MDVCGRHAARGEPASDRLDRVIEHRLGIVAARETRLPPMSGICRSVGRLVAQKHKQRSGAKPGRKARQHPSHDRGVCRIAGAAAGIASDCKAGAIWHCGAAPVQSRAFKERIAMESALVEKSCTPCRGGIPPLSRETAESYRRQAPDWALVDDATRIERTYRFKNFGEAFAFVEQAAALAEAEMHHPDISFGWGYATVSLRTKMIKGLHENDFIMAANIDCLAGDQPPRPGPIDRLVLRAAAAEPAPIGERVFAVRKRLPGHHDDNVTMRHRDGSAPTPSAHR